MNNVYLNHVGIVNALGGDIETIFRGLLDGSTAGMAKRQGGHPAREMVVGEVPDSVALPDVAEAQFFSRNNRLLAAAAAQIESPLRAAVTAYGAHRVAVILGTSTTGIAEGEAAIAAHNKAGHMPPDFDYRVQELANPAQYLQHAFDLQGPAWTISTACTSSAKALVSARRLLMMGLCDAVVAGGVDSLCGLTLNGFAALESVSAGLCNPFSVRRDGINIGEGAAVFLMTREPGPVVLLGAGESSDAYHISAPDPAGAGARLAINQALADAGLQPDDIDYVNLHGTGTLQNDAMEAAVVADMLPSHPPVSSTKPVTGHALGAAGAMEAAFCSLLVARKSSLLPPHVWDGEADPNMPALNFVSASTEYEPSRIVLSNSFAFGGSNACLILGASR